jgi:hypothetical protein
MAENKKSFSAVPGSGVTEKPFLSESIFPDMRVIRE